MALKRSIFLSIQLILLLKPFVLCDNLKPKYIKTSHFYRDTLFLSHEGQSCRDISDNRSFKRKVHFCSIPIPKVDTFTTLSFWGWDNFTGNPNNNLPKHVQVYVKTEEQQQDENNNNDFFLFEILVSNDKTKKHEVQYYQKEFIINEQYINGSKIINLNLYYIVPSGLKHELHLRDVCQ
mmetsp:Transcript_52621/g.67463  ORF Transcript_52621/g.67463 Transcript_52621/m.67463 type:complete len:179 (-) Transcript_52621:116-652(-)